MTSTKSIHAEHMVQPGQAGISHSCVCFHVAAVDVFLPVFVSGKSMRSAHNEIGMN